MKKLFPVVFFLFLSIPAFAGDIYIWTDKKGIDNITTTPPPEGAKLKGASSFQRDDPAEIKAFQRRQKAANDALFAGWQRSQTKTPSVRDEKTIITSEKKRDKNKSHGRDVFNSQPEIPSGAIDARTGQYYPPAAGGVIDPRTGTYHQGVAGGYINTRTGEFMPKVGP